VGGTVGRRITLALAVLIVVGAMVTFWGDHGIPHLLRLRSERRTVTEASFALLQTNKQLREEIGRLRNDDLYLEGIARRQLGLVHPGEAVFRFPRRRP